MGELFALVNAAGWSVSMVLTRKGQQRGQLDSLSGLFVTLAVNNVVNLVILLSSLLLSALPALNVRGLVCLVLGGAFNSLIGRGLLFYSIAQIGVARAGVIKASTPVFAVLGSLALLGERVNARQGVGIVVILAGVLVIALDSLRREEKQAGKVPLRGILVGVCASLFLALGNIFRKLGVGYIPSPAVGVFVGSLSALTLLTGVLLVLNRGAALTAAVRHPDRSYALSGLVTGVALFFLFSALERIPLSIANSLTALEPLFTLAFSRLLLGKQEKPTRLTLLGAAGTVSGALILTLL